MMMQSMHDMDEICAPGMYPGMDPEGFLTIQDGMMDGDSQHVGMRMHPSSSQINIGELGKKLLEAARNGDMTEVYSLINAGAPFTTDWLGATPLHYAAQFGHTETVRALLESGCSKDARTKIDRTALHVAAQEGFLDTVKLLVDSDAELDPMDMLKMTPLHWAAQRGHKDVIEYLLKNGADITVKNKFDKTPVDIALHEGLHDYAPFMKTFEGRARPKRPSIPTPALSQPIKLKASFGNNKRMKMTPNGQIQQHRSLSQNSNGAQAQHHQVVNAQRYVNVKEELDDNTANIIYESRVVPSAAAAAAVLKSNITNALNNNSNAMNITNSPSTITIAATTTTPKSANIHMNNNNNNNHHNHHQLNHQSSAQTLAAVAQAVSTANNQNQQNNNHNNNNSSTTTLTSTTTTTTKKVVQIPSTNKYLIVSNPSGMQNGSLTPLTTVKNGMPINGKLKPISVSELKTTLPMRKIEIVPNGTRKVTTSGGQQIVTTTAGGTPNFVRKIVLNNSTQGAQNGTNFNGQLQAKSNEIKALQEEIRKLKKEKDDLSGLIISKDLDIEQMKKQNAATNTALLAMTAAHAEAVEEANEAKKRLAEVLQQEQGKELLPMVSMDAEEDDDNDDIDSASHIPKIELDESNDAQKRLAEVLQQAQDKDILPIEQDDDDIDDIDPACHIPKIELEEGEEQLMNTTSVTTPSSTPTATAATTPASALSPATSGGPADDDDDASPQVESIELSPEKKTVEVESI